MQRASTSPIRVFAMTRKKIPNSRGVKQRFIIESLATQKPNMTRNAISKLLSKEFGIPEAHAYHYVLRELEECLIPNGFVEESGHVKPLRGSKVFQIHGIPCYRLTKIGALIASSLDKLDIKKRKELLECFLITSKILSAREIALYDKWLLNLEKNPESTLETMKDKVSQVINAESSSLLEIIDEKEIFDKSYSNHFNYIFELHD